jgi:hypothetical protein
MKKLSKFKGIVVPLRFEWLQRAQTANGLRRLRSAAVRLSAGSLRRYLATGRRA